MPATTHDVVFRRRKGAFSVSSRGLLAYRVIPRIPEQLTWVDRNAKAIFFTAVTPGRDLWVIPEEGDGNRGRSWLCLPVFCFLPSCLRGNGMAMFAASLIAAETRSCLGYRGVDGACVGQLRLRGGSKRGCRFYLDVQLSVQLAHHYHRQWAAFMVTPLP